MKTTMIAGALCAGVLAFAGPVWAQAQSGKWQGTQAPNIGKLANCDPQLKWTVSVANGKLTGNLNFGAGGTRQFAADVKPDGSFATTYKNGQGINIEVKGKVGDTFSVANPFTCGYGGMSLKKT